MKTAKPKKVEVLDAIKQAARIRRLAIEARRKKLHQQPEVSRRVQAYRDRLMEILAMKVQAYEEHLLVRALYEQIGSSAKVSDVDVATYYKEHAAEFVEPAGLRLRVIRCATEDEAQTILKRLKKGETFDALVKKTGTPRNGEIGWMTADRLKRLPPEVQAHVKSLTVSKLAGPVPMNGHYDVLKAVEKRSERQKPLGEVKDQIRTMLTKQRRDAAIERLSADLAKQMPLTLNGVEVQQLVATKAPADALSGKSACGCSSGGGCGGSKAKTTGKPSACGCGSKRRKRAGCGSGRGCG